MLMRFHHIGLEVRDVERAAAFYRSLYGFELEERLTLMGEEIAFLRMGEFRLELYEGEDHAASHICFEVDDIEPYLVTQQVLEGHYELENGWRTAFFQGVDGEVIELLQRNNGQRD